MARRIRIAVVLVLLSFAALSATACADASGPSETTCDQNNPLCK